MTRVQGVCKENKCWGQCRERGGERGRGVTRVQVGSAIRGQVGKKLELKASPPSHGHGLRGARAAVQGGGAVDLSTAPLKRPHHALHHLQRQWVGCRQSGLDRGYS